MGWKEVEGAAGLQTWAAGSAQSPWEQVWVLCPQSFSKEEHFVPQGWQPEQESDKHQYSPGAWCSCFLLSKGS